MPRYDPMFVCFCCTFPSAISSARTSLLLSSNAEHFSLTSEEKTSAPEPTSPYNKDMDIIKAEESTTDIAPDGDVTFLVGREKKRFRTYSLVVKNASKVFAALLGPHFSEGQALSANNHNMPAEILLPEDDPEAFSIIFKVIHGRNDTVPRKPRALTVLKVAIAVDKWDCRTPLNWAILTWLKCDGIHDAEELWTLMLAAYWFQDEQAFRDTTCALVLHHTGSYLELGRGKDNSSGSSQVFMMIVRSKSSLFLVTG